MKDINLIDLVRQAIDEIDKPAYSLTSVIRKAIRIACMHNDYFNQWWLENELVPYNDLEGKERIKNQMAIYCSKSEMEIYEIRINDMYGENRVMSVNEIEDAVKAINSFNRSQGEQIKRNQENTNQSSGKYNADRAVLNSAMNYTRGMEIQKQIKLLTDYKKILNRIELRVFNFLSIKEKQLLFNEENNNVFEIYQKQVDSKIAEIAPDAMEQLREAHKRVGQNNTEAWSQAAVSCRRVLKTLADIVYPPNPGKVKCKDGKERVLDDTNYKNRLWEYVSQKISGTKTGELLLAQIEDLGNRIDRLYDLSSKGTHDKIDKNEIYQCIIQTYLTVGDILFLYDK